MTLAEPIFSVQTWSEEEYLFTTKWELTAESFLWAKA